MELLNHGRLGNYGKPARWNKKGTTIYTKYTNRPAGWNFLTTEGSEITESRHDGTKKEPRNTQNTRIGLLDGTFEPRKARELRKAGMMEQKGTTKYSKHTNKPAGTD
jgi:hypothetical protein